MFSPNVILNVKLGVTYQKYDEGPSSHGFDYAALGFLPQMTGLISKSNADFPNITFGDVFDNIGASGADYDNNTNETLNPHLPIGMVDAVLIANAYHEFADPELTLDHTSRSLRFGGRLVVLDRSLAASNSGEEQEPHHELPPEVVDCQLRQKGFEILERRDWFITRPSGDRWWLIVARKPQE